MGTKISSATRHTSVGVADKFPVSKAGAKGHHNLVDVMTASIALTLTALRAIDAAADVLDGSVALVIGRAAAGDCEPFFVAWDDDNATADDATTVFRPSTGDASTGNGRWLRQHSSPSQTFSDSDATPSIATGNYFVTAGTPPAAITDFDNAYEGQIFAIERGAADQTITHNASVIDCGGDDITLSTARPRAVFQHVGGIHKLLSFIGEAAGAGITGDWASVATASSIDIAAEDSEKILLTGTTNVTGMGTAAAGVTRFIRSDETFLLTHHATDLICSANNNTSILMEPEDTALAVSKGSGDWQIIAYWPSSVFTKIDRRSAGGAGNYMLAIGADALTSSPDFAVDQGYSQTKVLAKSILLQDAGDTPEIGFLIAGGTPASPTARTAPYPGFFIYGWPRDDDGNYIPDGRPYSSYIYSGRNAQVYFPIISNPTADDRGGAYVISVTRVGTIVPIDRFWITGQSAKPGFTVFAGRAFEDSAVSYPYDPSSLDPEQHHSPMSGINYHDFVPNGVVTILTPDLANGAAISIRNNTSVTNGWDVDLEKSSGELRFYSVVSSTDVMRWRMQTNGVIDLGYYAGGSAALQINPATNQANFITVIGAAAGNDPRISVDGSDDNIDIEILGKGTGGVRIGSASASAIASILSKTEAIDFSSIAANGVQNSDVTLTGVDNTYVVFVSSVSGTLANAALSFDAWVSGANTVRVYCRNHSTGSIDPSSQTLRLVAIKFA